MRPHREKDCESSVGNQRGARRAPSRGADESRSGPARGCQAQSSSGGSPKGGQASSPSGGARPGPDQRHCCHRANRHENQCRCCHAACRHQVGSPDFGPASPLADQPVFLPGGNWSCPLSGGGGGEVVPAFQGQIQEGCGSLSRRRGPESGFPPDYKEDAQGAHPFLQRAPGGRADAAPLAVWRPGPWFCFEPGTNQRCRRAVASQGHRQGLAQPVAAQAQHSLAAARTGLHARRPASAERLRRNAGDGRVAIGKAVAAARHANRLERPGPAAYGGRRCRR